MTRPTREATLRAQTEVNQAIMWLCAQPGVSKHIRKLWKNSVQSLAARAKGEG
jgi:hypothetical protein